MKKPPVGIIEKEVGHPETLTFDYLNDENKPVYPETLEEQIEALKNDAQLEYFASCRKAAGENRYKPLYHFSQPNGVLNDPNGPCYWQGRWHLFYQHIMPFPSGDLQAGLPVKRRQPRHFLHSHRRRKRACVA